jgi:hypothetical protein
VRVRTNLFLDPIQADLGRLVITLRQVQRSSKSNNVSTCAFTPLPHRKDRGSGPTRQNPNAATCPGLAPEEPNRTPVVLSLIQRHHTDATGPNAAEQATDPTLWIEQLSPGPGAKSFDQFRAPRMRRGADHDGQWHVQALGCPRQSQIPSAAMTREQQSPLALGHVGKQGLMAFKAQASQTVPVQVQQLQIPQDDVSEGTAKGGSGR